MSQTRRTLAGVAANPNIGAVLLVGLGCETNQADVLAQHIPARKPIEVLGIQEAGGSDVVRHLGIEIVERFAKDREAESRTLQGAEGLCVGVLGVEADERAYRAVYPAVGAVIDRLVTAGARVILGVSGAMAPRADALIDRAVTGDAQKRLAQLAEGLTRKAWLEASQSDRVVRPYSDQERARAEKELPLSGSAPVASVVAYAERPSGPGLHLMTVSQNPVEAMTGLVAGGANIILVAASRGLFAGSIASPSVVVAPAAERTSALDEFVDHRVESEDTSLEAERILRRLLDVASGELCVAERERLGQFAISQLWTSF